MVLILVLSTHNIIDLILFHDGSPHLEIKMVGCEVMGSIWHPPPTLHFISHSIQKKNKAVGNRVTSDFSVLGAIQKKH